MTFVYFIERNHSSQRIFKEYSDITVPQDRRTLKKAYALFCFRKSSTARYGVPLLR